MDVLMGIGLVGLGSCLVVYASEYLKLRQWKLVVLLYVAAILLFSLASILFVSFSLGVLN